MRVEISALHKDIDSLLGNTGLFTAEYSRDTHRAVGIGNHHIVGMKGSLHSVECHDLLAFFRSSHYYLPAGNLISIKGMQRLAHFEENEIGNVDDIVDRVQADGKKLLLEPFRRRSYLYALDGDSLIFRRTFEVSHLDWNRTFTLAVLECGNIRICEFARYIVQSEICIQVSCYSDM